MKEKPNEWVSIADLMAGVMAVVMLLLVMSVLQKTYADQKHKAEMAKSTMAKKNIVTEMLNSLKESVTKSGWDQLVSFDVAAGKITLSDSVFERGSACITPDSIKAVGTLQQEVSAFLLNVSGSQVFVEGHTDNIPVSRPVTDFARFCTVYDDNFTLSAARAREARKLLIGELDLENAKRIIVAGYGDSQSLPGIAPSDAKNRRIEVRFFVKDKVIN